MSAVDPWDAAADGWDDDPAARAYAGAAFESLVAVLDGFGRSLLGLRVCDFGCGTGLLTERLVTAGVASVDAVDTSDAMLAELHAKADRLGWTNVRSSAEIPTSPGRHDLVVCSSVLAFVPDHPATVARLVELLAPGGVLIQWDWQLDPDEAEPYGLTTEAIQTALRTAGLRDVEVGVGFELPFGDMVMRPLMGVGRKV
ncbi:MAG: class I SAM-dependent methyltransferase [Actinomycetota bacterium]